MESSKIDDFRIVKKIGEGAYSSVWKAKRRYPRVTKERTEKNMPLRESK